jgi:hypothetical protein
MDETDLPQTPAEIRNKATPETDRIVEHLAVIDHVQEQKGPEPDFRRGFESETFSRAFIEPVFDLC